MATGCVSHVPQNERSRVSCEVVLVSCASALPSNNVNGVRQQSRYAKTHMQSTRYSEQPRRVPNARSIYAAGAALPLGAALLERDLDDATNSLCLSLYHISPVAHLQMLHSLAPPIGKHQVLRQSKIQMCTLCGCELVPYPPNNTSVANSRRRGVLGVVAYSGVSTGVRLSTSV